jgi:hypothetical protein
VQSFERAGELFGLPQLAAGLNAATAPTTRIGAAQQQQQQEGGGEEPEGAGVAGRRPTPIQAVCWAVAGQLPVDIVGVAETGAGKTFAFLVGAFSRLFVGAAAAAAAAAAVCTRPSTHRSSEPAG